MSITATVSKSGETVNVASQLTVTGDPVQPFLAVMSPESAEVAVGSAVVFAINTSGGAADATASWTCSSSDEAIATAATTDAGCQATGVAAGSVTINAAVTKSEDSANLASQLTVTGEPLEASMAPASGKVRVGGSIVFTITTSGGPVDAQLTWSCETSDANIATVTVTEAGCEATGVAAGSVSITATVSKSGETVNLASQLTVTGDPVQPFSATMSPESAEVAVGSAVVFAINTSGGAADATAAWTCSSSDEAIATAATTDAGCQATGVAAGGVTINAAVTKGGDSAILASQLTVTGDPIEASMAPASGKVRVGDSIVFTITTSGGPVDAQLTWSCETSDANIATVTGTEAGCEATGVSYGEAVITVVISKGNHEKTLTADITVAFITSKSSPAGIGDTVFVQSDFFFNGVADLRFILLDVDIQPAPNRPEYLRATATMDILLIEAHSRHFTAPISPLSWSSWSVSQSGQECFYGYRSGLTGVSVGREPLPIAPGTNWTAEVPVLIPKEASDAAVELLAFQANPPEFSTLGNCFGPIPGLSKRSGEAWFLLRGDAR